MALCADEQDVYPTWQIHGVREDILDSADEVERQTRHAPFAASSNRVADQRSGRLQLAIEHLKHDIYELFGVFWLVALEGQGFV